MDNTRTMIVGVIALVAVIAAGLLFWAGEATGAVAILGVAGTAMAWLATDSPIKPS